MASAVSFRGLSRSNQDPPGRYLSFCGKQSHRQPDQISQAAGVGAERSPRVLSLSFVVVVVVEWQSKRRRACYIHYYQGILLNEVGGRVSRRGERVQQAVHAARADAARTRTGRTVGTRRDSGNLGRALRSASFDESIASSAIPSYLHLAFLLLSVVHIFLVAQIRLSISKSFHFHFECHVFFLVLICLGLCFLYDYNSLVYL